MKRLLIITATMFLANCLEDCTWAQIPDFKTGPATGGGGPTLKRSTRPVVSPYVGLLGSTVGANSAFGYQYFTRVQPQINAARGLRTLGRSVNQLQARSQSPTSLNSSLSQQQLMLQQLDLQNGTPLAIGTTGHPVGYMSHTRYFGTNLTGGTGQSSLPGLGGTAGAAGAAGAAAPGR